MNRWLCIIVFLVAGFEASACDQCGGSVSVSSGGLIEFNTSNFVGLRLAAYHMGIDEISSADIFHTELNAAFKLGRNWQIFGYLPVRHVQFHLAEANSSSFGLGDPGLLISHKLFSKVNEEKNRTNSMFLRGGVELPVGEFNEEWRVNNIAPGYSNGSSSVDAHGGLQYKMSFINFSFIGDYSIKWHSMNPYHYQFGMQQSVSAICVYKKQFSTFRLHPFIGGSCELITPDHFYSAEQEGTNGEFVYANLGADILYKDFSAGIIGNVMVIDGKNISGSNRLNLRFSYSF